MKWWKGWRMSRAHSYSHSSFSNPSVASPTSQLILQPFCCFTYVTAHSPILLSLLLRHRIFNYITWRAAHAVDYYLYLVVNKVTTKLELHFHELSQSFLRSPWRKLEQIWWQLCFLWLHFIGRPGCKQKHVSDASIRKSIFFKKKTVEKRRCTIWS